MEFKINELRVSRGRTEYIKCKEKYQIICIQEKEMKTVKTFKYLGSMFDANGGTEKDVNNRIKIAWSKWRETTGVMCDSNIPTNRPSISLSIYLYLSFSLSLSLSSCTTLDYTFHLFLLFQKTIDIDNCPCVHTRDCACLRPD